MKFDKILNFLKKPRILSITIALIVIVPIVVYLVITSTYGIIFVEEMTYVEYGDEVVFENLVEGVKPEKATITYPDLEITEVGVYDLTFSYSYGNKVKEQRYVIRVIDTQGPQIVLKLEEDEAIEIALDTEFSPFIAIEEILYMPEFEEDSYPECTLLTDEEYDQRIEELNVAYDAITQRVIDNTGEYENIEVENNVYFYKTDLDVTTVGSYTMELCVVDSNYNYVTLTKEIKVMEPNSYLNTGGKVVCQYIDLPETDAYTITYYETYEYDIYKLVTTARLYTKMVFDSDYDTTENMTTLYKASVEKFEVYNDYDGVETSIVSYDGYITVDVYIDFSTYDKEEDPLSVMQSNGTGEIKITTLIEGKTDANCTIY